MMKLNEQLKERILKALPEAEVDIKSKDGVHFFARIISPLFSGKNTLQRHRMVYQALGDSFEQGLHAVELKTLTPEQAQNE
jgi:acid stress-induced BolA-like protein IbaG/YrbA